jgi:hypothetical protein
VVDLVHYDEHKETAGERAVEDSEIGSIAVTGSIDFELMAHK